MRNGTAAALCPGCFEVVKNSVEGISLVFTVSAVAVVLGRREEGAKDNPRVLSIEVEALQDGVDFFAHRRDSARLPRWAGDETIADVITGEGPFPF